MYRKTWRECEFCHTLMILIMLIRNDETTNEDSYESDLPDVPYGICSNCRIFPSIQDLPNILGEHKKMIDGTLLSQSPICHPEYLESPRYSNKRIKLTENAC